MWVSQIVWLKTASNIHMYTFTFKWFVLLTAFIVSFGNALGDERYRVMSGDNLYRIGKRFGVDYREIMEANRLKKTTIYPNQVLVIPSRNTTASRTASPPKAAPVQRSGRIATPPVPQSSGTYAGVTPSNKVDRYRGATVPNDPVEPFVSSRRLPSVPPVTTEEDPLGLGYNPSPYKSPPTPPRAVPVEPIASAKPVPNQRRATPVTPREPEIARAPEIRTFPRSREVPAAAHYPGRTGNEYALDPKHFPMPSFKNPHTPCPIKSSKSRGNSSRSYTVQSGDSVWSISRKFGITPFKLRKENNILFSRIRPGMCLEIPASQGFWPL